MRKRIAMVALGATLFGVTATASGASSLKAYEQTKTNHRTSYEDRYQRLYDRFADEFSLREAGRNWVRDGYLEHDGDVRDATKAEVNESSDRMYAALHPEEVAVPTETTTTTTYSGAAASSATAQCESGGDYTAVNPAGYYGAYQFDQGTWDSYAPEGYAGTNPAAAPPAVQDQAAASVPYDAWPNC